MSTPSSRRLTRVLSVKDINPPQVPCEEDLRNWFARERASGSLPADQVNHLLEAAHLLQTSSIPVAFPTETVYGLGADATRSEAVRGVFEAKRRPADNPLIVHVGSLRQLRDLLRPRSERMGNGAMIESSAKGNGHQDVADQTTDPIPSVYKPLISRFWPGPLTLLFPLPQPPSTPSPLAPESHPGLQSVGIRMPSSPLARLLITLSNRPLAAPSANASTRPSPTRAAHVLEDLDGRVDVILDGGTCSVGVESTVVDAFGADGRSPAVLRPGGVGIDEIRGVGGFWTGVEVGYGHGRKKSKTEPDVSTEEHQHRNGQSSVADEDRTGAHEVANDGHTTQTAGPRAPGMKYRHYAPRARVILFEDQQIHNSSTSTEQAAREKAIEYSKNNIHPTIGIITTKLWRPDLGLDLDMHERSPTHLSSPSLPAAAAAAAASRARARARAEMNLQTIPLGPSPKAIAHGLFAALRDLDARGCDVILIEGIGGHVTGTGVVAVGAEGQMEGEREDEDGDGDGDGDRHLVAAVMDRVRKAAEG